ncbi:glycosyltransferase family 2 protein [Clostridium peptidivorans]|uniref:glycosyltransferase family 2 protein n=1 Tax=Clostridium peptidivorans TaxID=100174 RepID=UPI001FA8661A|nr:glycosyltransferase family 2 protein [Clostridium peptidivorans]
MSILVSINCITYNHEKYIAEAIESFLMQKTNFDFEILIHDDASTDRTADIIRDYEKKYPHIIKAIYQTENQYSKGVRVFSLNANRAEGKYIAICEGDDYWTDPYKLKKQICYMENNPECGICFHAAEIVKDGKGRIDVIKPYNKSCISSTEDIILGDGEFIATNSILYRKDILYNMPDFYLNAPIRDYPLQILCSMHKYAYYINDFMSAYRVGVKGSWTSLITSEKNREEKIVNLKKRIIHMLNDFNQYSKEIYSDAVNTKILNYEFDILKVRGKIKQLKLPKYKMIYNSLGMKEKTKIYAKCYFPKVYQGLLYIKGYIK